jgi:hypothetical protein
MQTFKISETTLALRRIYTYLASPADGYTPVTTLTGPTVKLFRNGVALPSGQPTVPASLTHIANGHWYYDIPAIYLDSLGVITVTIEDTSIRPVVLMGQVVNYDWTQSTGATAQQVWEYTPRTLTNGAITNSTIAANAIVLRLANDPTASNARFTTFDSFAGYPLLSTTANNQVAVNASGHAAANVHQMQANVMTAAATDVTFVNELADAVWDELASGHTIADSFGKLLDNLASVYTGITGAVTSTVIATYNTFSTNLNALDDTYNEQTIVFTTGACAGQSVPVTDYTQLNGYITTEDPFTSEPQPGDVFSIIPIHIHKRTQIADALLSRLLDSSGSSNDVMNERTVRSALRAMRNRVIVNSGTMSVYKEDDQTAAWEGTLSNTADVTVNPDGGIE